MNAKLKGIVLAAGPLLFITLQLIGRPASMPEAAFDVLCVTLWMALWWITEVIPIAATALLPIILFPLTGAVSIGSTTASYGHKYVFLYLGGFILAIAIEKWSLHKRIALSIIRLIGTNIRLYYSRVHGFYCLSLDVDFQHRHLRDDASHWHSYY